MNFHPFRDRWKDLQVDSSSQCKLYQHHQQNHLSLAQHQLQISSSLHTQGLDIEQCYSQSGKFPKRKRVNQEFGFRIARKKIMIITSIDSMLNISYNNN